MSHSAHSEGHTIPRYRVRFHFLFICLSLIVGCSGETTAPAPQPSVQNSLKQIAVLYGRFAGQHRGQGPKSESEFRAYLEKNAADSLKAAVVNSVDELLKSPRDNQPFIIRFGLKLKAPGPEGAEIIAMEKAGVDGKHFAVDSLGGVREISNADVEKLK